MSEALIRQYYQAIDSNDWQAFDACVAPKFEHHTPRVPAGREVFKHVLRMYRAGFPDMKNDVQQVITSGEQVVVYTKTSGTHQGDFLGHEATQKQFTAEGIDIFRVQDGQIVERRGVFDTISMLQQLGLYQPSL